ncbi:GNAT family N-acetyltransferase [Bradyrhizobium sp. dw_78]|uniref:bifunctional acetate--CoA ligase family protein/GNAT family N-acetyltransferase n=1 Tax=Bradyrhizobium sp. dw_78 TaxID=2719793 RepID=UPI001BD229BC
MSIYRLDRLFAPRSLALVGGSECLRSPGRAVIRNILDAGFGGQIGVVNPHRAEVGGLAAQPKLSALGFVPGLIVVTAPAALVPAILAEAGARGVAGAVILSSGFDRGEGARWEQVRQAARKTGMRIVGPNSLGIAMPGAKLNASLGAHSPRSGNLAFISQSADIAAAAIGCAAERQIGFSGLVSVGDELDVDIADCLDYFALDQKTRAILLHLESVRDARKFMSAARAAARLKPVVVVRSGCVAQNDGAEGRDGEASIGSDAVYDAAFRRAGLLRMAGLGEMFCSAEVLGRAPLPAGKRLAVLTDGAALGVLAINELQELGGVRAELMPETQRRLEDALPAGGPASNPVDIASDAEPAEYAAALDILLSESAVDGVVVIHVATAVTDTAAIATAVSECIAANRRLWHASAKPVLASFVGADAAATAILDQAGVPHFAVEDEAIRAFMHLVRHRETMDLLTVTPPSVSGEFKANRAAAERIIAAAMAEGRSRLDSGEVAELLAAYEIASLPTKAGDAVRADGGFLIGMFDDPVFGPVMTLDRDGRAVARRDGRSFALPPMDMSLARDFVQGAIALSCADPPSVAIDEAAIAVVKLSQMIGDFPALRELGIDLRFADGGLFAFDAAIGVGKPAVLFAGNTRLAVRPYPVEWETDLTLNDDWRVFVRPIRPEDEPDIRGFLGRVDLSDLRLRFLDAIKEFPHAFLARLVQLDYARAMAFVAFDKAGRDVIGVARLHSDSLYEAAEYAILLRSDLKGKGLGWGLMELLIRYARSEGLKRLTGQVLQENSPMLAMCRELGFSAKTDAEDGGLVNVTLELTQG